MNSPSEPRLNKLPFFLTDAACLLAAGLIGYFSKDPFAPLPLVCIALLVIAGGSALLFPYLTDYAADSSEASARLRDEIELQIKRAQAAGESLTRAAAQIKAIEEAVHKSARDAETLPYRMQEKLAEFNEALAAKENDDREALEQELEELRAANSTQLKAVAEKIAKAATDWAALEVATRQQLTGAEAALAKLHTGTRDALAAGAASIDEAAAAATTRLEGSLAGSLRQFEARLSDTLAQFSAQATKLEKVWAVVPAPATAPAMLKQPEEPAPTTVPAPADTVPAPAAPAVAAEAPAPAPEPTIGEAVPDSTSLLLELPAPSAEEAPKQKKPRAPRRPRAEEILPTMSEEPAAPASPASTVPEPEPESAPLATAPASPAEDTPGSDSGEGSSVEASASSDGATRLLATAYIGIGNRLFIRGDGPGLSWDRGIPMQFVSIGKWGWFTHEATGPVRIKLYKNDEIAALSGEITLEPGRHSEVTGLF